MVTAEEITRRETRGSASLWFGVLGAPAAWAIALLVGYSLEEWFACSPATVEEGSILGLGVRTIAIVVPATMLVVAVSAGLVAWRCLNRVEDREEAALRRARWMAIAGIFNSILYGLAIATSLFAPAILEICETSP